MTTNNVAIKEDSLKMMQIINKNYLKAKSNTKLNRKQRLARVRAINAYKTAQASALRQK